MSSLHIPAAYAPAIQYGADIALAKLLAMVTCPTAPIIAAYGLAAAMRLTCALQACEAEKRRDHLAEAGVLAALAAVHVS